MTTLSNLFSRLFNFLVCCLGVLWEIFTMIFPFFAWWIFSTRHHRFNFTLRRSNASSCFNFRNIRMIVFLSFWLAGVINFLYRNEVVTTTNLTIPSNLLQLSFSFYLYVCSDVRQIRLVFKAVTANGNCLDVNLIWWTSSSFYDFTSFSRPRLP